MKLFELERGVTIDLEKVTAIYYEMADVGDFVGKQIFFARCDGKSFRVPDSPEGLVDDLFEAWEAIASPRANLRPCKLRTTERTGFLHQVFYENHDNACALVEADGGKLMLWHIENFRFADVPESEE